MAHYISTKINETDYIQTEVPECIYVYIRQLEECIKFPDRFYLNLE